MLLPRFYPGRFGLLFLLTALLPCSMSAQLRPFTLPWNDASPTVTDFSGLNTAITVSSPRIAVNAAGQLTLNGARERMIGVNLTVDSAFPSAADAAAVAGRLAKFGFNAVRFHHLEAPWGAPNVLVDYTGNTSRNLSATQLDRLHRFVAELAAQGIYSDLNLLVSRQFYPNDGFPASINQLDWKSQQCLSFFDDHMVALQKEYAQKFLTAPNPHRANTSLATDPAVGFVEILNESGYLQAWHDGVLDTLPVEFATTLRAHWNAWLANRYANSTALLAGWEAINEPLGAQLLTNPNFAAGSSNWNLERHDSAVATTTATTTFTNNAPAVRIDVTTAGSADWHVQFNQSALSFTAGQIYTASFWARSTSGLPINGVLARASGDFASLASVGSATLTSTWQLFTATFVAATTEPSVRFNFNGFGNRTGSVEIAAVSFSNGGQAGTLADGVSLESRNIPALLKNGGSATAAQKRDWFRYLIASETTYWETMYSYIKNDLGFAGLVFGTIVSTSPAGVQAHLDAVDSHFYWAHPVFPGTAWDPSNWYLNETGSAVNTTESHIGSFARQRVAGKPFFNTEYQHTAPNQFGAEAPLIPAAYGAFQDWDGFWFFEYGAGATAWNRGYISSFFSIDTDPTKMANVLLAAAMFRRGDVEPARTAITIGFDSDAQLQATLAGNAWSVGDGSHLGLSPRHAFESRVALDPTQPFTGVPAAPTANILTSDTGQLVWDNATANRGVVTVDTPRTKAIFGHAEGRSIDLDGWIFTPGDTRLDWLTAGITTVSGDSLQAETGVRALLIVTGERASTGWVWTNANQNSLGANWGSAPTVIEVVPLTLDIPHPASRVTAWALDGTGARTTALTVTTTDTGARLQLGQNGATLWYEIVIAADPSLTAPSITLHPTARLLTPGDSTTLNVTATGTAPLNYQWFLNGNPIANSTSATVNLTHVSAAHAGSYTVSVTNGQGTTTSRAAQVVVDAHPPEFTGLLNLSTRIGTRRDAAALTAGFVLAGAGTKRVLLRAVGPGLFPYGINNFLPDPTFTVFENVDGTPTARQSNDNWDATAIGNAFGEVGAFPLPSSSADAALVMTMQPGVFTAPISDPTDAGHIVLVELYDLANGAAGPRVLNLSSRGFVGAGDGLLVAGFVIPGSVPRRLLIRAVGPGLEPYGVTDTLADPQLEIVQIGPNQTLFRLAQNDDWFRDADATTLASTMQTLGAFPLGSASKDAAVLVELEPGAYSALVRGAHDSTGIALVEVYAVP